MKELLFRLLFGAIGMLVVYASMSFYKLTLNPVLWTEENRFIVTIIGLYVFIMTAIFSKYFFEKD